MKYINLLPILFAAFTLEAQTVADFEAYDLPPQSFVNGAQPDDKFEDGNIRLQNDFNTEFMSWSGFAISNVVDITTPGFNNQYAAYPGKGAADSDHYAVSYLFGPSWLYTEGMAQGEVINGLYLTNSTYAYLSMLNGDAIAKKFGGPTGDDPDFFKLRIEGYYNGNLLDDSVVVYLADFRFEDNSEDYIVDDWMYVDLKSLGRVDSLVFNLSSSDVGSFGMNTPAYFCIDNVETSDGVTSVLETYEVLNVYPNPATAQIQFETPFTTGLLTIMTTDGKIVYYEKVNGASRLNLSHLTKGMYMMRLTDESGVTYQSKLIKQ